MMCQGSLALKERSVFLCAFVGEALASRKQLELLHFNSTFLEEGERGTLKRIPYLANEMVSPAVLFLDCSSFACHVG